MSTSTCFSSVHLLSAYILAKNYVSHHLFPIVSLWLPGPELAFAGLREIQHKVPPQRLFFSLGIFCCYPQQLVKGIGVLGPFSFFPTQPDCVLSWREVGAGLTLRLRRTSLPWQQLDKCLQILFHASILLHSAHLHCDSRLPERVWSPSQCQAGLGPKVIFR